jgi:hypothetical protein
MLVSENNRTAPYRFSQLASGRHMSGRELDRKRNNEGRRDGRVHDGNQTGIWMIGRENETRTTAKDRWSQFFPPASAEFAVLL